MVGTGRIELPTSSVSRKRSPTELRACEIRRGVLFWLQRTNIKASFYLARLACVLCRRSSPAESWKTAQEIDFTTNFHPACQLGTADRRGPALQPDQTPVKILASGKNRYNGGDSNKPVEHRRSQ